MTELVRRVIFTPVRDRRNPDPSKDYGLHSIGVYFMLYGDEGIVEFQICSRWLTPELHKEIDPIAALKIVENPEVAPLYRAYPADVCVWRKIRHSSDCLEMYGIARVFDGGTCYYDYKPGGADEAYMILCNEGDEGVWKYLEDYYNEQFREWAAA